LHYHNRIIQSLKGSANLRVIEAASKMDLNFPLFLDVCHFSSRGNQFFVDLLLPFLLDEDNY